MTFYATYRDYCRVNKIVVTQPTEDEKIGIIAYLRTAATAIDTMTRRRFVPDFETRVYEIPVQYADLRHWFLTLEDLTLDKDLLEPRFTRTGGNARIESGETVPVGGLTETATTFIAVDVDGEDENGDVRFAAGDILEVDDERLLVVYTSTTTNEVRVLRGALDTVAAAHTAGTTIYKRATTALAHGIDYTLLSFNAYPKYALRPVGANAWGLGEVSAVRGYPSIYVTGFWGYHERYANAAWANTFETVPSGGLSASATVFTAADADGRDSQNSLRFEEGYLLRVDDELMEVTDVNYTTNAVTVLRGQNGTLAQPHSAGTPIRRWSTQADIVEAAVALAKTWREADSSVGGRQGVSEMSQGVEIQIPSGIVGMLNRYVRSII